MQDKTQNTKLIYVLSALAAIFYSSWILGYYLNIHVATNGTASQLAAFSQPYREVFVIGDALTLLLVFIVSLILFPKVKSTAHKIALVLYGIFGVLSFYSSLVALSCSQAVQNCSNTSIDLRVIIHNLVGLAGLLCLLTALVFAQQRKNSLDSKTKVYVCLWILAGLVSIAVDLSVSSGMAVALSQRVFLCFTAFTIFLVPSIIIRKT